ncbi:MAG: VCBS repeat-containing protein [Planctomycetes bacterium]|nr:VCBS repeat-containing protein [Planctomycetota bacterium]
MIPRKSSVTCQGTALGAVLLAVAPLSGCGGGSKEPGSSRPVPPVAHLVDLDRSEPEALRLEQDLLALLLEPLARGDLERASRSLDEGDFAGTIREPGPAEPAAGIEVRWLKGSAHFTQDPDEFVSRLRQLGPRTASPARVELELDRFELEPAGERAIGRVRLRWAGVEPPANPDEPEDADGTSSIRSEVRPPGGPLAPSKPAVPPAAQRVDVTLYAEIEAQTAPGEDWRLTRFHPCEASDLHPLGAGVRLQCDDPARYVDRTMEVGLTFGTSAENERLLQDFVDRHRTLTLGGLSVVDFDRDGFDDLIATRSNESTILFRNDGVGGFVPIPLPMERLADRPAFVLFVDLDGDGLEEIVASETSRYRGAQAFAGLWTRTDAEPGTWRHLPDAFALPNPVGLRRLAVQTVAPLDVEGDGDLDLFFAVYGSGESRGPDYNTVEAHDGADNHLLINQGGLRFTEESEARGITGTGYTYVALAFDADHDGDTDLFEGNDFGPNVLWRNEGGRFVADDAMGLGGVSAYTMGAALADLECDGRWDLYVSNMSSEEGMRMVPVAEGLSETMRGRVDTIARGNALYSEPAEPGPWPDRARGLGVNEAEWAWGCQFVDVNGDGAQELVVTNGFASHRDQGLGDWQTYYWRQVIDDGRRLERGERSEDVNESLRFQGSFNGHERDRLFVRADRGPADRPWVDAGWCLGIDASHDGRAIVPFDPDGDGDLDLALWTLGGLVYYENRGVQLAVRLKLVPERGPRVPLGARVKISGRTMGEAQRAYARHVSLIEGFQSQVSPDLLLPTAHHWVKPTLEITWPSGQRQELRGIRMVGRWTIQEGSKEYLHEPAQLWPRRGDLIGDAPWPANIARTARTPAALGLAPAPLVVRIREGRDVPVTPLVLAEPEVRVVEALLRTGGPEDRDLDPTREVLLEFAEVAAALDEADQATLVYDADGRLLRVFRGPVDSADVEAFCDLGTTEARFPHLLIEHGRLAIDESRFRDALALFQEAVRGRADLAVEDAAAFEGIGRSHVLLGRVDLAEKAYRAAVELDPDYAIGHLNLGAALAELGRFGEATDALLEARRVEGDTPRVLGALVEAAGSAGRDGIARESALAWLEQHPGDVPMMVLLGKVEARAGNLEAAIEWFEAALAAQPSNGEAAEALQAAKALLIGNGAR